MERIEVITGVQRRRRYSAQEKAFMVAECELLPLDDTALKRVAEALKVLRTHLLDRVHSRQKGRSPRYSKQDDESHRVS